MTRSLCVPLYAKFSNLGTWIAPLKLAFTKETMCRWIFACENRVIVRVRAGASVYNYQPLLEMLGAVSGPLENWPAVCWCRFEFCACMSVVPRFQRRSSDASLCMCWPSVTCSAL